MRIKVYFSLLVLLLTALGIVLFFLMRGGEQWHLFVVEGSILCMLVLLYVFYGKVVSPLNSIGNGMDLLREQDFSSRLRRVGQKETDRIINIFNRMMDQLKYERLRLREQNHFLDLLINASPMGVVITSLDYEVSQLNPVARKMLGIQLEEMQGKKLDDINVPLAKELAKIPRESTVVVRLNDANIYKCTHTSFIDQGHHHPFYLIESMTEELIRAEKRAYEKVIRMIAHEVNNSTAGITSTLDTVEQALADEDGMEEICEMMHVCTERCLSMSRFITRFADVVKIPEPNLQPACLNELAATCKRFMEGMCNERSIALRLECDTEVQDVKLDVSLMEQVLVNIIKNAVESIGRNGEIIIRTTVPACIEVEDNGPGISLGVESRLFTPFFSTKPNGQGIGLVFIREVLSRHNCRFSLHTHEDGKTRFHIRFV